MTILISILLCVVGSVTLSAQNSDSVRPGRDLIPLLPYIFFDSGSATLPSRYIQFVSPAQTTTFSEYAINGDALELHRHILNILGERLSRYPATSVTIGGYSTNQPEIGETRETAQKRAEVVRDYLATIWGIDRSRLTMVRSGGLPLLVSNLRDPIGITENRRVEVLSGEWEITRPILMERIATPGLSLPRQDRYWLILFAFDSPQKGLLNERIMTEYIYPDLPPGADVAVTGYTRLRIHETRSTRLSMDRAQTCITAIRKNLGREKMASISIRGSDSAEPPYLPGLPEAEFYNRCVLIEVTRK